MKILVVTNKMPYPPSDGGAIATLNMINGLRTQGNELSVWSLNTQKHYFDPIDLPNQLKNSIHWHSFFINTNIKVLNLLWNWLFSRKPYIALRFISRKSKENLTNVLLHESFDIIQIEGLYMLQYIPIIKKVCPSKTKIVFRAHNVEHEIWQRQALMESNPLKRLYLQSMSRRIKRFKLHYLNTYDALIPISRRDADFFSLLGNSKPIMLTPVGFDFLNDKREPQTEIIKDIFFLGALDWAPNLEGLRWFIDKVWPLIKSSFPELKFHVAGRNASESLVKELLKPGVIYHGEVKDAYEFMMSHGIMIVPLFSGSGMRVKIVEGMALGKTIISTDIGAEGIAALNNEEIIYANVQEDMALAISELLRAPEKIKNIGEKARIFAVREFDNQILSKKLNDFYIENVVS